MQDSTTMSQAAAIPQASIPSSAPAPTQAYQSAPVQSAPASYQTPSVPQQVDPTPYQQAPAAPQANPWQQAFERLSDSLSATRNSQPQAAYSTPTPQQAQSHAQAWQASAPAQYQAAPSTSGLQTSIPQATQAFSPQTQAPSYSNEQIAPASDEYLASVSNESLEVLEHFGAEAPALLNRYSCVVEDALLAQAQQTAETMQKLEELGVSLDSAKAVIEAAAEDNAAYHVMLTNPDMLAAYVNDFFGPEGPYPQETPEDRLAAEVAANTQQFQAPAPAYQRPEIDMPQPGVQAPQGGDDFWSTFSAMSDRNPSAAWQMLAQAGPDALRSKILVSEG
ncbi:MAG: hypothetical protein CMJ39_00005 [Phycisphaerae bacterium]|nr:hypothetical protein [Phycisphaerae bacterium]